MAHTASRASSTPPPARALLLALAALLLCLQGLRGLWDPDEGRYSATAWRMLETGDWFTPHISADVPHFTKPPLTYWVLGASMGLFGRNEWALRLPIGLAGVGTMLLAYAIARRLVPRDPLLAAAIQATALLPFVGVHLVTTDPFLMLFETMAVWGFVAAWWDDPTPRWALPAMWLGLALAFLTKGPPALLPLLPILVFATWSRGLRGVLRVFSPTSLLLFALVASPWFLLQMRARPDLLAYFLGTEVEGRVLGVHGRSPGWRGWLRDIVGVAIAGWLPWSVVALPRWRRAQRKRDAAPPDDPLAARFLWLWLALPLLVFSLVQSRQPLYLLPLSVPGSLLLARVLAPRWRWSRRERAWLAAWALFLVAITAIVSTGERSRDGRRFALRLAPLLERPPATILFVDRHALYSLAVYFDCDVRSVELLEDLTRRAGPSYRPLSTALSDELARPRPNTVWLVRAVSLPAWRQRLDAAGWQLRRLGRVVDYEVFDARPPNQR